MYSSIYKTSKDFEDNCICAYSIYEFIDNMDSNVHWFFDICYEFDNHNKYSVTFCSYKTSEYKDFSVSVEAIYDPNSNSYDIKLINKTEPLLHDNEQM